MTPVLQEIETVIRSPEVKWRQEELEVGAMLYIGVHQGWQVQVAALGSAAMGTAVHTPRLLIMKMPDQLAQLTLQTAKAALP